MSNAAAVSATVAHRRPAGWYPDEIECTNLRRWWDGVAWTDYWAPFTEPHLVLLDPIGPEGQVDLAEASETAEAVALEAPDAAPAHPLHGDQPLPFKPTAPVWVATALVTANCILFGVLTH